MSTLRTRFGIPGIIATVALVFAMTGGAFAAKYLITSTKQISPSVLKKLKGAKGAAGAAGAQGPAGPAGAKGDAGTAGAAGKEGPQGKEGKAGKDGTNGKDGEPWTAGGTLPPGATETGSWGGIATPEGESVTEEFSGTGGVIFSPISFSIPLAADIENAKVIRIASGGSVPPECDNGAAPASGADNPEADPGYLCVFVGLDSASPPLGAPSFVLKSGSSTTTQGASRSGAIAAKFGAKAGNLYFGTYAVTACGNAEFPCPS